MMEIATKNVMKVCYYQYVSGTCEVFQILRIINSNFLNLFREKNLNNGNIKIKVVLNFLREFLNKIVKN